ncbi:MAG: DHH family phosphoesterase [Candidatus Kariarchaeaceae archaeon]
MLQKYSNFLKTIQQPHLHIFLHHNADPDALCAGETIGKLSQQLHLQVQYTIYSDGLNKSSKRVADHFEIKIEKKPPSTVNESDLIITVDTGNYSQLGYFQEWVQQANLPLIMFDHHDEGQISQLTTLGINDSKYASTCIILAEGYLELNLIPSERVSTLLLCGHLYDSRRFIHGSTANTFRIIAFLIESGGDFNHANSFLQNLMPVGERIARLKAARRLTYNVINGEFIIVTSSVGAFESSSARSFINLGADVVLIIAEKDNELRGSGRTRLVDNLNMSEILTQISTEFGGSGGGHEAAAGLNITPCPSKNQQKRLLKRFVTIVEGMLKNS